MDEKLFGRSEELRLHAVRGRAEREECFGKQQYKLLPAVQGWSGISHQLNKQEEERERRDERPGWRVTHGLGYSQTETANALASTASAKRGPSLSRQTRLSWTVFGHRSKVWTLGA